MSEFSERCKQLLTESGSNVYQIAKRSSLDRTTIQRMITGKRLPSQDFVKDFCTYLRISPIEKSELLELYKMEKIGKSTYMNCWYIKNLIESLASVEHIYPFAWKETFPFQALFRYPPQNMLHSKNQNMHFQVKEKILSIIEQELQSNEQPEFLLNLPPNHMFLFYSLQQTLQNAPEKTCIKHLITLNQGMQNSAHSLKNLETLSYILPVAKILDGKYHPHYIYSTLTSNDEQLLIMPYCIITPHYLLTISSDFESVSILDNEQMLELYRSEFMRIFSMTEPLINYTESPQKILSHLCQTYTDFGKPSHSFEFHPCFFFMGSVPTLPETLTKTLPNISELTPSFQEMFKPLENSDIVTTNFFSEEGLKIFSSTGKCFGQYNNIEEGFSPEDRKRMLNRYCQNNLKNDFHGYMIKPDFKIPTYISIELHNSHCLHLFSLEENFKCSFVEIRESSICETFYEFFEALPNSELSYTKEETCNKIADYIAKI